MPQPYSGKWQFLLDKYQIVAGIPIPLPPLSIQQEIVKEIELERRLIHSNKILIVRYERKIKDKIGKVWGE